MYRRLRRENGLGAVVHKVVDMVEASMVQTGPCLSGMRIQPLQIFRRSYTIYNDLRSLNGSTRSVSGKCGLPSSPASPALRALPRDQFFDGLARLSPAAPLQITHQPRFRSQNGCGRPQAGMTLVELLLSLA